MRDDLIERLRSEADDLMCPHSAAGRPERFPAKACILAGECGCVYGAEWSRALRLADDAALETLAMTTMTFNGKTFEVDDEIASIVHALNAAGIATVASCSGHGMRPGRISLADGRELFVLPSYEIGQWFDTQFPRDINGKTKEERADTIREPVAYISQEDFEFLLSDDMSEQYGTRQAPVFSRKDYRVSVPLYASPQPSAQDVRALLEERDALRAERDELLEVLRNALHVLEFEVETRGSNDLLYEIPAGPVLDAARAVIAKAEGRSDE